ncbi:hypothetical protein ACKWMY_17020 [Serratia sp. J2]|uniref:hypothetical protein n=1 Tax=Serratia sp. J2 TaxID=3386551 RepID=UPI003917186D
MKNETNEQFYARRVNRSIEQIQLLKGGSSDAYRDKTLTIGNPPIFINEPIESIISYYSIQLLELFNEGVRRKFNIPPDLLAYISTIFSQHIESKGTTNLSELFNATPETFKQREKRWEGMDLKKIIALSVCYRGFRCGFSYRRLGIYIDDSKLKIDMNHTMTRKHIVKEIKNAHFEINIGQRAMINSFLAGYSSIDSERQSRPPYEPTPDILLKLVSKLFYYLKHEKIPQGNQASNSITKEDLLKLKPLYYPKGEQTIRYITNNIEKNIKSKHPERDYLEIRDEAHNILKKSNIDLLGDSPRIITLSDNYDIPLLLATDEFWSNDPRHFFYNIESFLSTISEKIEALNQNVKT